MILKEFHFKKVEQYCFLGSQDLLLPEQPAAPGSRDEVRKVMLELEEVREQLQESTKKERQAIKNHEQASRFAVTVLKMWHALNVNCFQES